VSVCVVKSVHHADYPSVRPSVRQSLTVDASPVTVIDQREPRRRAADLADDDVISQQSCPVGQRSTPSTSTLGRTAILLIRRTDGRTDERARRSMKCPSEDHWSSICHRRRRRQTLRQNPDHSGSAGRHKAPQNLEAAGRASGERTAEWPVACVSSRRLIDKTIRQPTGRCAVSQLLLNMKYKRCVGWVRCVDQRRRFTLVASRDLLMTTFDAARVTCRSRVTWQSNGRHLGAALDGRITCGTTLIHYDDSPRQRAAERRFTLSVVNTIEDYRTLAGHDKRVIRTDIHATLNKAKYPTSYFTLETCTGEEITSHIIGQCHYRHLTDDLHVNATQRVLCKTPIPLN